VSLVARHLEADGIPTVIMAAQGHRGILRRAALPLQRLPARQLGGAPARSRLARADPRAALRVLESAPAARTTVQSPLRWGDDAAWKLDFNNLAKLTPEDIAERRKEFESVKRRSRTCQGGNDEAVRRRPHPRLHRYLAGPYGTYQLALLGADVVKIESRDGDETRSQLVSKEWRTARCRPASWRSTATSAALRSTCDGRSVEIVKRLVATADVVWRTSVRRHGQARLGYDTLSALNPRLIYCAVSGFGHSGPERTTAAFDGKLQAMSGIMSITGEPAGGPMRAGFAICDTIGGMTRRWPCRARSTSARTPAADSSWTWPCSTPRSPSSRPGLGVHGGRIEQKQIGNGSVSRKPTANRFRAKDGYIVLAVLTEKQFVSLMKTLGRAEALNDPRFKTGPRAPTTWRVARGDRERAGQRRSQTWETR